ncbi:hypothetical protein BH09ACT12_BH09ACT12_08690 [soil metagenome]
MSCHGPDEGTGRHGSDVDGGVVGPHWTVGDRLIGFTALLPIAPVGPVVLAVEDVLAEQLAALWPSALVLTSAETSLPARLPVGAAALVIADETVVGAEHAQGMARRDGVVAVLGRRGSITSYPGFDAPEMLWCSTWPITVHRGPLSLARRWLAVRGLPRRESAQVAVSGAGGASLADLVVRDVARALGRPFELRGVLTAGRTVLRCRPTDAPGGELAVALELVDQVRPADVRDALLADLPAMEAFLAPVLASGVTLGRRWQAAPWLAAPGHRPAASPVRRAAVTAAVADLLASTVTGHTGPGWAQSWCDAVHVLPEEARARWAQALLPLEEHQPTSWCHGDLWPGNVLASTETLVVIDWDNACADAPQGIDSLLTRRLADSGAPVGSGVLRLVDEVDGTGDLVVLGRPWVEHDRRTRVALAIAAVALYLRNRSTVDLDPRELQAHLDDVERVLQSGLPADDPSVRASGSAAGTVTEAGRTARGALWLATNGVVVKASQTAVLLALAAALAPSALGLVAIGTLVANLSAILSSLGTASALVYWRGDVERAARTAVSIGAAMSMVLAAVLWVAAPGLASVLRASDGGAAVIRGLIVTLPCLAVAAVTNELLRRELAFLRRIIPDTCSSVAGAAVAIVLVVQGSGVMALVAGQIVQGVLTLLLTWVVHKPVLPGWNRADARGLLEYGAPYSGTNLLELVQLNVDYVLVSRVLGSVALGHYSLGFRIAFMPYLMIVVVTTGAAFPYLCRMRGSGLARAAEVVMAATMTLVLPACVLLMLMADHLTVLGDKWDPAVPVLALLAGYAVLLGVTQVQLTVLNAAGLPALSMAVKSLHLVLLTAVLLLVVHRGVASVALAQVVVAGVVTVVALLVARRQVVGLSVSRILLGLRPAALSTVAMAVVVVALRLGVFHGGPSLVSLLGLGVAGGVTFLGGLWVLGRDDLRAVTRMLRVSS